MPGWAGEDCDECVELDETEGRAATDAWERMMQWRRSDRRPRQRDTASVRREQAAARREQGLADDPEAAAAAQAAVRAAQLQRTTTSIQAPPRFDCKQLPVAMAPHVVGDIGTAAGFVVLHVVGTQVVPDARLFPFGTSLRDRVVR